MIDLSQPAGRLELIGHLQDHAVHIARLATALQPDTPSQVGGSTLVSAAVQALQLARRFHQEPTEERFYGIVELLETQATWLEVLAEADLAQPEILRPHRDRVLALLEQAFNRTI